jgi:hypothetical protein
MQPNIMVVGVFDDPDAAERALAGLREAGFRPSDVGVVTRPQDAAREAPVGVEPAPRVDETSGVLTGGLLGGVAGWLVGLTTLAVPGVGPLLAAGPLAAAVSGSGLGAAAGGLLGHFVAQGHEQDEARWYEERVRAGAILLTVHAHDRSDEARAIMRRAGGHDFRSYAEAAGR